MKKESRRTKILKLLAAALIGAVLAKAGIPLPAGLTELIVQ